MSLPKLIPWKHTTIHMPKSTSVSLIRTLPHRRIFRPNTTPRRITRRVPTAATVAARIMAGEIGTIAAGGVSGAAADAIGVAVRKAPAGAIFPLRNMLRRKAIPAATIRVATTTVAEISAGRTIAARRAASNTAAPSSVVLTIGAPRIRVSRAHLLPRNPRRSRFFFPANRSQNIAASRQPRLLRPWLNPNTTKRNRNSMKRIHASPAT